MTDDSVHNILGGYLLNKTATLSVASKKTTNQACEVTFYGVYYEHLFHEIFVLSSHRIYKMTSQSCQTLLNYSSLVCGSKQEFDNERDTILWVL